MKFAGLSALLLVVLHYSPIYIYGQNRSIDLIGAWQRGPEENRIVWINAEKHFSAAVYNLRENKFIGTCGGTWKLEENTLVEVHEFNTMKPDLIGKELRNKVEMMSGKLVVKMEDQEEEWTRIDDGTPGKLAGAWLITGRVRDGQVRKMIPGSRKTMKILSGTRFQWIAYNSETKEFSATGGGTYTTENGKYVEHIDFFSRDNSRTGAKLEFDFLVKDDDWHHKGLSSKADPVDEIWTKRQRLGI